MTSKMRPILYIQSLISCLYIKGNNGFNIHIDNLRLLLLEHKWAIKYLHIPHVNIFLMIFSSYTYKNKKIIPWAFVWSFDDHMFYFICFKETNYPFGYSIFALQGDKINHHFNSILETSSIYYVIFSSIFFLRNNYALFM